MAGANKIDHGAVAERVERVREYLGCVTHRQFADKLGVSMQRINNVLRGHPLSRDVAFRMTQKVPGLTFDWLWLGNPAGLPLRLAKQLVRQSRR